MPRPLTVLLLVAAAALAVIPVAAGGGAHANHDDQVVRFPSIENVTVSAGGAVTFINSGAVSLDMFIIDPAGDLLYDAKIAPGHADTVRFSQAGTYLYICGDPCIRIGTVTVSADFPGAHFFSDGRMVGSVRGSGGPSWACDDGNTLARESLVVSVDMRREYVKGANVTISGAVRAIDPRLLHDVSVIVVDPAGNIAEIRQATPDGNGSYSASMIADGPQWGRSGDYRAYAHYSVEKACMPFAFFTGHGEPPAATARPPPPPAVQPPPAIPPLPPPPVAPVHPSQAIVVWPSNGSAAPHNFTDAGDSASLVIDMAGLLGQGGPPPDGSASSATTFPASETHVAMSFATVTFPPSATATHVPAAALLTLHVSSDTPDDARAQAALAYGGSGRVEMQRVVEVGAASGRIEFDVPVRILLEGQAGGRAFYIEGGAGGAITPIDLACAADDVSRVHRHLGGAGECQMDSAGGGKIIYTYHLTQFGTALPELAAPPPAVHTCSVSLGMPSLSVSAEPGRHSPPALQTVINSGSAPFARVGLAATPWGAGLPASATEVSEDGPDDGYGAVAAQGAAVAHGLGGGQEAPLWFRLNLAPHGDLRGGTLTQNVTYSAQCSMP